MVGPPRAWENHERLGPKVRDWIVQVHEALKGLVVGVADVQLNPETGTVSLMPTVSEGS
ncbi:MAG TPA: hypothetical protein VFZ00_00340 [Solirubrobacter sp.]|nr:hypothetical protein [Solirubrobacter sp.]